MPAMLDGKKILLAVTGSIAAYKAAILVRLLVKEGAEVKVIMTPLAKQFIAPLTLATLSRNPILVDFFDPENGAWNSHVSLGGWADAMLIAPATANTIAKMVTGVADNLAVTTYLSAKCPVFIAPAMDLDMYAHPSTQYNIDTLRSYGNHILEPAEGELASGLSGKGRMEEPEMIVDYLGSFFRRKKSLEGKTFMVTAGPTIEPIDPVRYISNHSSGKMGYAIADELQKRGARVILISGKTALRPPVGVETVDVTTAEEMYGVSMNAFEKCDGAVMCAAVADYAPVEYSKNKIKKEGDNLTLPLAKTRDIAAELGKIKGKRLLVGFALETEDGEASAEKKINQKNFDFIVMNSLSDQGAGFGTDTNKITILGTRYTPRRLPLMSKTEAASNIVDEIEKYLLK